jgi:hypothetical protein
MNGISNISVVLHFTRPIAVGAVAQILADIAAMVPIGYGDFDHNPAFS